MEKIQLKSYAITISEKFAEQDFMPVLNSYRNYESIVILADKNTEKYCLPLLDPYLDQYKRIIVEPGEEYKEIRTCLNIWQQLIESGITRNSLLINLGGGVITDIGGFTAGTFKRGFDFINIPTTLLAQVDASVGSKTGIDFNGMKNMIGLFNDPKHIFISPEFLKTLPFAQIRSGFAEVLKHGLISDRKYWDHVKMIELQTFSQWLPVIQRSVEIKKAIVEADQFETGLRKILNFGHTIGHAVETLSLRKKSSPLLHGEAIAIGMYCEAWLSAQLNRMPASDLNEIVNYFQIHFPKVDISSFEFAELLRVMKEDKKNMNDSIQFSLLSAVGACQFNIPVSEEMIREAINFYIEL